MPDNWPQTLGVPVLIRQKSALQHLQQALIDHGKGVYHTMQPLCPDVSYPCQHLEQLSRLSSTLLFVQLQLSLEVGRLPEFHVVCLLVGPPLPHLGQGSGSPHLPIMCIFLCIALYACPMQDLVHVDHQRMLCCPEGHEVTR